MTWVDRAAYWIREQVEQAGAKGVVVGLSGGVDSACVAGLAKRAVGDNALGLLMPCHSQPVDEEHGRLVAETFGLETVRVDLAPTHDRFLAALPDGDRMARANLKPRLRMATLYYFANARGYLVAGTGNKAELMVGYFTKFGDGGCDILPLGGLLKREVRALARELGVPGVVIAKPPTAGLWPGQTDEGEMGLSYDQLDDTLAAIAAGDTSDCDPAVLAEVQRMVVASAHKRAPAPIFEARAGKAVPAARL